MNANKQLIRALQSNNRDQMEEAFELIYHEYHKLLFYIVIKIVKRKETAEDIVNDVFLSLFNNLHNLDETRNLKYYLVTAAKNASINELKKAKVKQLELDDETILRTADQQAPLGSWQAFVEEFKGIISDDDIDIIVKHLIFNWTFKDIAFERGVSLDVVTGRYRRAIKKLKQFYAKEDEYEKN